MLGEKQLFSTLLDFHLLLFCREKRDRYGQEREITNINQFRIPEAESAEVEIHPFK